MNRVSVDLVKNIKNVVVVYKKVIREKIDTNTRQNNIIKNLFELNICCALTISLFGTTLLFPLLAANNVAMVTRTPPVTPIDTFFFIDCFRLYSATLLLVI